MSHPVVAGAAKPDDHALTTLEMVRALRALDEDWQAATNLAGCKAAGRKLTKLLIRYAKGRG